ncbi:MAG: CpsD/CapB family tyrosine-protein kinase [Anaerolineae bacterium]|nr:CpsD/CapB family tyrosine-protein kinase [Anaerolineae bacterium]MCA9910940.1 CpsD/CapB family tyrosine-protein kinase [Anaerolineae bacterium]
MGATVAKVNLITLTEPRSATAEAYRTLRTNLMFANVERPVSTLLVTTPTDITDKSLTLANLAITFAQAGNNTILVDSNLRQPVQHELWGLPNDRGLTTMMSEDAALASPPLQTTDIPHLSILTSGPSPDIPADVLSSQRINEVIGLLKARANFVLFDSPPVLTYTDASLLGIKLDGVLMVARAGNTRRDHIQRAQQALERVHARLLGVVLTNAPRSSIGT